MACILILINHPNENGSGAERLFLGEMRDSMRKVEKGKEEGGGGDRLSLEAQYSTTNERKRYIVEKRE